MAAASTSRSVALEMQIMAEWFSNWSSSQRRAFLESVVPKIVPQKLFARVLSMNLDEQLSKPCPENPQQCNSFEEQVLFCHRCLDKWTADDCNHFMNLLEEIDRRALYLFYDMIAATAGELIRLVHQIWAWSTVLLYLMPLNMSIVECKLEFGDGNEFVKKGEPLGSGRGYYQSLSEVLNAMKEEVNSALTVEVEKAKQLSSHPHKRPADSSEDEHSSDDSDSPPDLKTQRND